MGDIDHEHRQIGTIIVWPCRDIHEVFESPVLLRVSKIALQLEAQSIIVDQEIVPQRQVTTEEHHMSGLVGVQMCFDNDYNIQHLGKFLMPERPLVNLRLDLFVNCGGLQVGRRYMPFINLLTIFAAWSTPTVRAIIGKIERRIIPQLRDQMQAHLSDHVHRIVMTAFTIEKKVHDFEGIADLLEQPLNMLVDETKRRAQFSLATVAILAPFRPSSSATGLLRGRRLNQRLGGLFHWFGHDRVRSAVLILEINWYRNGIRAQGLGS